MLSNPAGIICSSCNFLSADRVVLTTGKVNTQNDTVDSYKVEKGNITVKGNATFDKSAQQIDLIARNVSIETPLDASGINVNVITGANEVKAQDNTVVAQKPTGVASKYSLQIVKNAGVRSSSLKFIGTEANSPLKNNGNVETAGEGSSLFIAVHLIIIKVTSYLRGISILLSIKVLQIVLVKYKVLKLSQ
ncbi:hypothetical protein I3679_021445 [Proteus mirabilis]|uniref:Filamentous haemagglutinin FhaB/tRNA nuclease CdiA-like TPS domain-containing protein n=1 Tax=Proteus mirabilis TaxID=584 RepID=A0ABD5LVL3_PROMI